jgi:hypothetical protein
MAGSADDEVVFEPRPGSVLREPIKWTLGPRARVGEVLAACAAVGFRRTMVARRLLDVVVQLDIPDIASIEDVHFGVVDALERVGIEAEMVSGDTDRYFARPPLDELIATRLKPTPAGCSIPYYILDQLDQAVLALHARCQPTPGGLTFLEVPHGGFFAGLGLRQGDRLEGFESTQALIEHLRRKGLLHATVHRGGEALDRVFIVKGWKPG